MRGGQWRADSDRETVESGQWQGDSGGQAVTGEQWRAGCDKGGGAVEDKQ